MRAQVGGELAQPIGREALFGACIVPIRRACQTTCQLGPVFAYEG